MSAVTIELPDHLLERLRGRAAEEGLSVEQKALELLERWAQDDVSGGAFHRQVEIARDEFERYRNTFRELSS